MEKRMKKMEVLLEVLLEKTVPKVNAN